MRRLTKSNSNRFIFGVCGGVAEFFGIDVTLVRIAWAVFTLFGGSGFIAYIICAIIMPSAPVAHHTDNPHDWNHPNSN